MKDLPGPSRLCFPTEETLAAVNRPALGRPKGNRCLASALRAHRSRFRPLYARGRSTLALGFARFAPLWFIFEVLVVEEMLLSRRENELRSTIRTLNDSILELWHHYRSRSYPGHHIRPLRTHPEIIRFHDEFSSCFACEPALAWPVFSLPASSKKSAV